MFILEAFFYLLLISIPFGTRFLIYQFTAGFHEYETAFIYLSDIILILFLIWYLTPIIWKKFGGKSEIRNPKPETNSKSQISNSKTPITNYSRRKVGIPTSLLKNIKGASGQLLITIFLFFAFLSIFFAVSKGLAIYSFMRLALLVLMALAAARILSQPKVFKATLAIIAILGVIQSGIGFLQFKNQGALGLKWLGESPISVFDGGTSKIIIDGACPAIPRGFCGVRVMRAYGTFPHPNILSAFLILGLSALYYFWLKRPSEWKIFSSFRNLISDLILGLAIFIVSFGILISFSRAGWLITALMTLFIILYSLFSRYFIQAVRLGILALAVAGILFLNFNDFILPRATISAEEPALTQRLTYNDLGIDLIKSNPLGVGIGNQVLYSVENRVYQKFGMDQVWQWQPIHNVYLLIASEIGILGLLAFLAFITWLLISNFQFPIFNQFSNPNKKNSKNLSLITSYLLLVTLLLFSFFDHFLWTIQSGRLMLWLAIGLTLGNTLYYNAQYENRS